MILSGILLPGFISCDDDENPLTEAQKLAALRNVTVQYNELTYEIGLPPGALSGRPFEELMQEDPETYTNPENYSISIAANMLADNTREDAEDAKFDGMDLDIIMDTIETNPILMEARAFEVEKGKTEPVDMTTTINLSTHREPGLYIFRQTVDGNDLATTQTPFLHYDLGIQQGTIELPSLHEEIPTRASDETKEFLRQVLDSGIFEEEK
jgi:hypothetical protein